MYKAACILVIGRAIVSLSRALKALSTFQAGYMTIEKLECEMELAAKGLSGISGKGM